MAIADGMIMELRHESVSTRKMLERVPMDKGEYKPHPKSMPMIVLASHIAEIPGWAVETMTKTELAFDPSDFKPWRAAGTAELLAKFDEKVAAAIDALQGRNDVEFLQPWSLIVGGKAMFTLPRVAVMRSMVLSHLVHHRAQLGVYLRMNDVPLPSVYGPSADENP